MGNARPSRTLITLGATIKRFRDAAGLSQRELAKRLNYSNGWVSNVETGQLRPDRDALTDVETVLGVPAGVFTDVLDLARTEAPHPVDSFERYAGAEATATEIYEYQALVVLGLVQTPEYAQAVIAAGAPNAKPEVIEDLVKSRIERQEILSRDAPPTLWLIITEVALRQAVGSPEVHRAQLDRLLELASQAGVTVQVVPQAVREHAGLVSSFTILGFDDASNMAYSEDPASGHLHERSEIVKSLWHTYLAIAHVALPKADSLAFMKKVREEL